MLRKVKLVSNFDSEFELLYKGHKKTRAKTNKNIKLICLVSSKTPGK
jgi:hypothetical protein